ncbi:hypothetical protein [Streptomyces sp. NPDC058335]|uniref:hypothetical protein n=1 Tax=Streptomyces sp. NPDC058335 TaxID=3346451 RepID=UPI00365C06EF
MRPDAPRCAAAVVRRSADARFERRSSGAAALVETDEPRRRGRSQGALRPDLAREEGQPAACGPAAPGGDGEGEEEPAFPGETALSTSGRIVLRGPSQPPLDRDRLAGGVLRVPWSQRVLHLHQQELSRAVERQAESVADCPRWLAGQGGEGRDELLEQAKEAAQRTAPFVLYQENSQYTNFRDQNTITGKTLWPGHPDCTLSSLSGVPLELWSDSDVQLVVCLSLLTASSGFGRVEEANGTQITTDHVAFMLERIRRGYNEILPVAGIAPAASHRVADLAALAEGLRQRRAEVGRSAQLYREIHGALMHKIERVAGSVAGPALEAEAAVCRDLRARLPLTGTTLAELGEEVIGDPAWLAKPHSGYGTGLESLVHRTVAAVASALRADFAMSRGMRSLPALIAAMRDEQWEQICAWDLTHYFCCVVPLPDAGRHFGGSSAPSPTPPGPCPRACSTTPGTFSNSTPIPQHSPHPVNPRPAPTPDTTELCDQQWSDGHARDSPSDPAPLARGRRCAHGCRSCRPRGHAVDP